MDDRGRLAQPLTGTDALIAAPTAQWRRALRRFFHRLVDLDPPRGVGTFAVVTLLTSSIAYGVSKGDHGAELAANLNTLCDAAANAAGFRISSVALNGEHRLTRDSILAAAGVTPDRSLLCLDATATRDHIAALPWVSSATVLKLYPGRLQVDVTERRPIAVWQKDGAVNIIATDGTVLEPYGDPRFANLPLVVGDGADHASESFLATLERSPQLRKEVKAAVLVARRRWNLILKNDVEVQLPEKSPDAALALLTQLDQGKKLLSRDIVIVDLRLPDRVRVRLSDDAAQARDEALKDKKPKAKRNDA